MEPLVVPIAYLPSIAYFVNVIRSDEVIIDIHEHYIKQTCRNRTYIGSASGALPLVIPVKKVFGNHTPVSVIEIDNAQRWQRNHWRALESAYQSSPYFLYYMDDFHALYKKLYSLLIEFNMDLMRLLCRLTGLDTYFTLSDQYIPPGSYRRDIRNERFSDLTGVAMTEPYQQVFQHKHGFTANLSVIDLLFNLGPECRSYLNRQTLSN
ncbi:MAG: WbqC family protein [Bacteroidales bacterium]|nr:WbqC family protein [Lentimicrobiaceae bacterium]MDD5693933.1 WbqC family protein [Bacteroidales bacterium]